MNKSDQYLRKLLQSTGESNINRTTQWEKLESRLDSYYQKAGNKNILISKGFLLSTILVLLVSNLYVFNLFHKLKNSNTLVKQELNVLEHKINSLELLSGADYHSKKIIQNTSNAKNNLAINSLKSNSELEYKNDLLLANKTNQNKEQINLRRKNNNSSQAATKQSKKFFHRLNQSNHNRNKDYTINSITPLSNVLIEFKPLQNELPVIESLNIDFIPIASANIKWNSMAILHTTIIPREVRPSLKKINYPDLYASIGGSIIKKMNQPNSSKLAFGKNISFESNLYRKFGMNIRAEWVHENYHFDMKPIQMNHHLPIDPPIKKDQEVRQIHGITKDVYWNLGINYEIFNQKKNILSLQLGHAWINSTRQPIYFEIYDFKSHERFNTFAFTERQRINSFWNVGIHIQRKINTFKIDFGAEYNKGFNASNNFINQWRYALSLQYKIF